MPVVSIVGPGLPDTANTSGYKMGARPAPCGLPAAEEIFTHTFVNFVLYGDFPRVFQHKKNILLWKL